MIFGMSNIKLSTIFCCISNAISIAHRLLLSNIF